MVLQKPIEMDHELLDDRPSQVDFNGSRSNIRCLKFNPVKSCVVSFTTSLCPIDYDYAISGQQLQKIGTAKGLGIMFDSRLTFKDHFDHIIDQTFKSLGFIIRTSRYFRSIETVVLLYVSLVRSKLEYASVVWSPHYNQHIEAIEKIQHKIQICLS